MDRGPFTLSTAKYCTNWLVQFEAELGFRPLITGPSADDIHKQDQQLGATLIKKYAAQFPPPDPFVVLREHSTPSKVRIKSYTPSNASPNKPAVCYFHGGGFVVGEVDRDDILVSRLAKDTGLVFASVEYRLAPQNPYPAGFNDCIDAAKWCIEHADALGTNGTVVLMGGSAGATFALGTALKLIEDGELERLKGIVACQPMTLHPDAVPDQFRDQYSSYDEHATNTLNSAQGMRAFFGKAYFSPFLLISYVILNRSSRRIKDRSVHTVPPPSSSKRPTTNLYQCMRI